MSEGMTLYHGTLAENAPSIESNGIMLNRRKADREDKYFTDVFNYVFNEKSELYLPERVQGELSNKVDRNDAIFFSAFPGEFSKVDNLGYGADVEGKSNVTYEVKIDGDLVGLDSKLFDKWTDNFHNMLNDSRAVVNFYGLAGDDPKAQRAAISSLMTYVISGDDQVFEKFKDGNPAFPWGLFGGRCQGLGEGALLDVEDGVKAYSENAVLASDVLNNYSYLKDGDGFVFVKDDGVKYGPQFIESLEILCNEDISPDRIRRVE